MGAEAEVSERGPSGSGVSIGSDGAGPIGRIIDRVLWGLAAVPVAALALLASMVVRVRLADGAWPSRDQPDPKDLGWHNSVTAVAIVASFLVVVLVLGLTGLAAVAGHRRVVVVPLLLAVGAVVILAAILWGDPGGIGQWIAD